MVEPHAVARVKRPLLLAFKSVPVPLRPHVHPVAVLRGAGLELELLADSCAVGLPVPAARQHPLLAADGLPV